MPKPPRAKIRRPALVLLAALPLLAASCAPGKPPVPRTAEEQLVETQMTFMAQQTVGDYLFHEGIPPNGVLVGPPKRTYDGWDFDVWRKDDPDARTVVRVKESSDVAADDLEVLRPKLPDSTFTPRQTTVDPNAELRQR